MNARPSIQFGTELALVMDWIRYDALNDEYLLQHNNLQMMSLENRQRDLRITKESVGKWKLSFCISAYLPIGNLPI